MDLPQVLVKSNVGPHKPTPTSHQMGEPPYCCTRCTEGNLITQGNGADVYLRFTPWLISSSWISDKQKEGLTEGSLDLTGESASSIFQKGALSCVPGRDNTHIIWVLKGNQSIGCLEKFSPCSLQTDDDKYQQQHPFFYK